jgi:hypothetical protein
MLSHTTIESAQPLDKPYKLFDEHGLYLLVTPRGARGWRMKYRVQGHEKLLSLGPYPTVSLAKARLKLRRAKALLLDGIDPSLKRKAEKYAGADSFEAVAREWYGSHECRWADSYSDHIIRRFTASTLLNEQGWRPDAIERQLAHGERDHVRAVYNLVEYLPERKLMMQGWGNYLDELRVSPL